MWGKFEFINEIRFLLIYIPLTFLSWVKRCTNSNPTTYCVTDKVRHNFILSCIFFLTMLHLWQVTEMFTHVMLMRLIGQLRVKHFESFSLSALLLYWKVRTGWQVISQCTVLICCTVNICHTTEYHESALLKSCSRCMLVASSALILSNCVSLLFADLIGLWFNNTGLMSWWLIRVWCHFQIIFEKRLV